MGVDCDCAAAVSCHTHDGIISQAAVIFQNVSRGKRKLIASHRV